MFLLHDAKILDKFNSDHLFWIDAGITNTVHQGYFTKDNVLDKISNFTDKFMFICFPYETSTEIHGFEYNSINIYSKDRVNRVARGGFFGGKKSRINELNGLYYSYLNNSLHEGLMGTEESIFTIILYNHPNLVTQFKLEDNGLVWPFFEDLKDKNFTGRVISPLINPKSVLDINKTALYVITFNSPKQFETLITSMLEYDKNFVTRPKKFLLDNSTDESTTELYSTICKEYDFEHIKKDNLGICGGRQWIAEHFEKTGLDYYFFFEDDMFFYPKKGEVCKNGFNRCVDDLYNKTLSITNKENYDFLKYNFTEFYGDNSTQWSWYNVPQVVREEFWPENSKLPVQGLDPNAPRTLFKNIKSYNGLPYADGEVYYCNWPQIVSKIGNKKMFLDTTWAHPYEQTWMSHMYQLTKKGELNSAILLLTPTEHNRFDHYDGKLRKES
jgi:hypothetical protein